MAVACDSEPRERERMRRGSPIGRAIASADDMTHQLRTATIALVLATAAPSLAQLPDLAPWDGIWVKAKVKQKGFAFRVNAPGVQKDRGAMAVYLQLHVDGLAPEPLTADVWVRNDAWEKSTIPLLYLGGAAADFAAYFNQVPAAPDPVVDLELHLAFVLRLRGKIAGGVVGKGTVKSLGGYFIELDDVPGSDERFAGALAVKGKITTKIPPDLPVP